MYSNINNPVNYQLQGFGQNGVRTISTDQLYIQGEYYRVLVAEEDSYVTAVSVLGDDLTAEFVYAGTTIYGLFTEVSVSSGSLTAYIAGPTDIDDVWAYINAYGQTNAATIEAADCAKDAIAPLLDKYYAKASLVMVPSLYKTSIVYSERPLTTDGQLAFTRSNDTATRVGPDGLIEKVRTNLLLQSNGFNTATWLKSLATVTGGQEGYDGSNNAFLLSNTAQFGLVQQSISNSGLNTFSVYAKAGTFNFLIIEANFAGGAWFNLLNGTVGTAISFSASIQDVGNGWYRCSISGTASTSSVSFYPQETNGTYTLNTGSIYIQYAQLETGDIATDYIATTSAAVSVGPVANVPRLDYLNSSCPRLLLEGQRVNLVSYSEAFNDASWAKTRCTVTANAGTSPDGYDNADKFVEDSTNNSKFFAKSVTTADSSSYTLSLFAKAAERNEVALVSRDKAGAFKTTVFGLTSGTIVSDQHTGTKIEDYGNGWYRCSVVFNSGTGATATTMYVQTALNGNLSYQGDGTSGILIYGAGWELGSYVSSYIPTLGAAVTRGADACSKTGISSLIGQTDGTIYLEADIQKYNESGFYVAISAGGVLGTAIYLQQPSSGTLALLVRAAGNTNQLSILNANWTAGFNKVAIAYTATEAEVFINGVSKGTVFYASAPACSQFTIGSRPDAVGGLVGTGPYKQALLFKTRLTNQELQDLTTL